MDGENGGGFWASFRELGGMESHEKSAHGAGGCPPLAEGHLLPAAGQSRGAHPVDALGLGTYEMMRAGAVQRVEAVWRGAVRGGAVRAGAVAGKLRQ